MRYLLFSAGERRYAVAARQVERVVPFVALTAVPGAPPEVAGLFHYNGVLTPVVDLSLLLAGVATPPLFSSRMMVVATAERCIGLLAGQMTEVVHAAPEEFVKPGIERGEYSWLAGIKRHRRVDGIAPDGSGPLHEREELIELINLPLLLERTKAVIHAIN